MPDAYNIDFIIASQQPFLRPLAKYVYIENHDFFITRTGWYSSD